MSGKTEGSIFFYPSLRGLVLGFVIASFLISIIAFTANANPLAFNKDSALFPLLPESSPPEAEIIIDGPIGKPSQYGLDQLLRALQMKGASLRKGESLQTAHSANILLVGTLNGSSLIKELKGDGKLELAEVREALAVKRVRKDDKNILIVAGSDDRGLMYALLELAQQVKALEKEEDWFTSVNEVSERPCVPVRGIMVLLHNADCEREWYYSKVYWEDYFGMLAADRWNSINLVFSHQTPYLSPMYAFHVNVEQYPQVKARGLTEEQRKKNLEMLRYISSLAEDRGIDFTLGIWQQIAWESKTQFQKQESMVTGLTRKNMTDYTYLALSKLLKECPGISAIQLRVNHESGLDFEEQTPLFRDAVYRAAQECGRPILIDVRTVGLLRETIEEAVNSGLPARLNLKYWGEHMVFPYHPTRLMWTYSYGDWLKYPHRYSVIYQVWTLGSHRLLLWGNPDFVRRFAPTTKFEDGVGFEICAPLSQKGYMNVPGAWRIFRYKEREYYQWEFERYWSFYRLFGRLTYNPAAGDELWLRELRQRFGKDAAPEVASAYRQASRVLSLIMGSVISNYNMYIWPEKDMGGLLNYYLHLLPYDRCRISSFLEYVNDYVEGNSSAKLTPEEAASRLETVAAECEQAIARAEASLSSADKEFWATKMDFLILTGMARYHAQKMRAAYRLGFYYRLGDLSLLKDAIANAQKGLELWKKLSSVAEEIYYPNLVFGPSSVGHWKDNIVFVENDLSQLQYQEELFRLVQNFDYGFDFGPRAFTNVITAYSPIYTNYYTIEQRFQGVFPHSFYNSQQGYGWVEAEDLRAEQLPRVPGSVWNASNLDNLNFPPQALLGDFVQGNKPAVFRLDLPEGHYQATLLITDRSPAPADHGPMSISVVERFDDRPIIVDKVVRKGEMLVKRFNFNMVGSRFSTFRLKLSASPGADYILNALTITRIEPHIAHLPLRRAIPGKDLHLLATVTLPRKVVEPHKDSLSIAYGTTSTVEPPEKIEQVTLHYSVDKGKSYRSVEMQGDDMIYSAIIPDSEVQQGEIRYYLEATDSIGQSVRLPKTSEAKPYFIIKVNNDRSLPVVIHTPVKECNPGEPLEIRAKVTDNSSIARVLLYYRPTRQTMEYSIVPMHLKGDEYSATIPGEAISAEFDLMYYIEAVDANGNGVFYPNPDFEQPYIVVKVRR
ncbi:hypothetical protein CEE39_05165 [bacterium (candidate division B38) B3_B38]|nr:MAG: hypothetical protein CEE39_05165 [bacterium (candidate division B38) B3_B38]